MKNIPQLYPPTMNLEEQKKNKTLALFGAALIPLITVNPLALALPALPLASVTVSHIKQTGKELAYYIQKFKMENSSRKWRKLDLIANEQERIEYLNKRQRVINLINNQSKSEEATSQEKELYEITKITKYNYFLLSHAIPKAMTQIFRLDGLPEVINGVEQYSVLKYQHKFYKEFWDMYGHYIVYSTDDNPIYEKVIDQAYAFFWNKLTDEQFGFFKQKIDKEMLRYRLSKLD